MDDSELCTRIRKSMKTAKENPVDRAIRLGDCTTIHSDGSSEDDDDGAAARVADERRRARVHLIEAKRELRDDDDAESS